MSKTTNWDSDPISAFPPGYGKTEWEKCAEERDELRAEVERLTAELVQSNADAQRYRIARQLAWISFDDERALDKDIEAMQKETDK